MCRFKSGIILKTRSVVAEGEDDSHSALLETLNIEDDTNNAMTKFVRVELIPPNNEWWTDPDTWEAHVDQDMTPDWFEIDKEKYFADFKETVKAWWKEHVLIEKKVEELKSGYYRLKRCEVEMLLNEVNVMCDNSTVNEMYDNSTVSRMCDNSTVNEMCGNSTVSRMCDNSTVNEMYDNSTVNEMCDNSTVNEMYGNSTVSRMYDNSTVSRMYDNSTVSRMCGNSTVSRMCDNSTVSRMYDNSTVNVMCGNSTVSRMYDNSTVNGMYDNSTVSRMYDNSIARDYADNKIYISDKTELEIVKRKNE